MTIKLEVGKKYRNRLGEVITITEYDHAHKLPFGCYLNNTEEMWYMENGQFFSHREDGNDLIEEVIEPVKKPHKNAEFIKAWADGTPLQKRYPLARNAAKHRADWHDFEKHFCPDWEADWIEYRIKPATKPDVVEFYVKMNFTETAMNGSRFEWVFENGKRCPQLKVIWDGETGELKDAEVIK